MTQIEITDFILQQLVTWWQFTVVGIIIIIGWIINLFDDKECLCKDSHVFEYSEMPHMIPIPIATKDKGFWGAIWMWMTGSRNWIIAKKFVFKLNGVQYIIPKGFQFDGASIPKFLHTWLSPTGVLLMGGLVHDYAYKYETLKKNAKGTYGKLTQKESDKMFRDINIEINGFKVMNYLAYWALRLGGFAAWNKHRKVNAKVK
tara:strand:- start:4023 stop:4628 length:606 start_codon:yes stop_codon:yes gene_type:complete